MIRTDEDALTCDFAETYHIFDMRGLPVKLAASLAVGLRADSRIKMKLTSMKVPLDTILLAGAVDRLSLLVWAQTKDAKKGHNKPKSLLEDLVSAAPKKHTENVSFASGEDYEKARAEMLAQIKEG